MKKITSYIKRYWYAYLFAIFCMIIAITLDMVSPQITKHIIDDVIIGGNMKIFPVLLVCILAVGFGKSVFTYMKELTFDCVSSKIGSEIRRNLFRHIQELSISFFDKTNTGELMARVKDDVDRIWNALGFVGMLLIEVVIHSAIVLWCMFQLSPKLTIVPFLCMPVVAWIAITMEKKLGKVYEEISEENAVLNTVAEEDLAGIRTVKAFAREKYEIKKFLSHNHKYYDLNMRQSKIVVKYQPMIQLITKLLPIATIIYGGYFVISGEISLGTLGAFSLYATNIVWPMEMLGWLTNDFSSAVASSRKIKKIYEESPEIKECKSPVNLEKVKGEIEFCHVDFMKNGNKILDDITFHVEPGKTLGIMGATGTGKTTIINLLLRTYDADSGSIKFDKTDIRKLKLKQLRSNISFVMQEVFLFSDTIAENIKLGRKEQLGQDEISLSVSQAQAKEFIERMEQQYDTVIGERGVGLSGGQKQRISIARALAKNTPVLILDDATSALDMETEKQIQETLDSKKGITKIIIAHRISAVRNADEILVLDNGKIAERGTHDTLLKKKKLYYETYQVQYGENGIEGRR